MHAIRRTEVGLVCVVASSFALIGLLWVSGCCLGPGTCHLTLTVIGSGHVAYTPAGNNFNFTCGTAMHLQASADPNWTFKHWEFVGDGLTTVNPLEFTLSEDTAIKAVFEQ